MDATITVNIQSMSGENLCNIMVSRDCTIQSLKARIVDELKSGFQCQLLMDGMLLDDPAKQILLETRGEACITLVQPEFEWGRWDPDMVKVEDRCVSRMGRNLTNVFSKHPITDGIHSFRLKKVGGSDVDSGICIGLTENDVPLDAHPTRSQSIVVEFYDGGTLQGRRKRGANFETIKAGLPKLVGIGTILEIDLNCEEKTITFTSPELDEPFLGSVIYTDESNCVALHLYLCFNCTGAWELERYS